MDRESYHNCCSLSSHFVDYIEKELSYSKFFKKYLLPNHPCMSSRKFTKDWKCRKQWLDIAQLFPPVCHRDFPEHNVYTTHSWYNKTYFIIDPDIWLVNICGRKKWLLYPPGQEEFLRDSHGNLAYDVTTPSFKTRGSSHSDEACQPLEIIQKAGEIIFVLSGWHHQVYNLEDTISINHNWLNGCKVGIMWQFLQNELSAVQRKIEEHYGLMVIMKSCSGIDYREFASFLKIVADNRMSFLSSCSGNTSSNYPLHLSDTLPMLGPHHAAFDLQRVAHILECMLCKDFKKLDHSTLSSEPESLLQQIKETIHSTRGQHSLYQE
uniref:Jumonji domain-containing protein 4 n=1 Tax=Hucho hucho TaxID=62062 RepID=A0A4W5R7G0_9TELE